MAVLHLDLFCGEKGESRHGGVFLRPVFVKWGAECLKPVEPIRMAERAWIVYRDAWVRFAKVRWPEVSEDSWLTFLSEERVRRMASYPGQ